MLTKTLITIITMIMLLMSVSQFLKNKPMNTREKTSPFECGFDPQHKMRSAFSLRFFLITILFLIFDVEILVMLPLPSLLTNMESNFLLFNLIIFTLLTTGLGFEWSQGALKWK